MMRTRDRLQGDRGVTAVLFALVLITLMIFAAFAVDVSGVYSARRADQSAADAAALGGVQTLLEPGSTDAQVEATVLGLVVASVGGDATGFDWNSCNEPDDDVVDTPINGKNCITTTTARDILQVRLPKQSYPGGFARVAGVSLEHSAFAIAGIDGVGIGGVLPLPMANGSGGGDGYVCVRTSSGGALDAIPPCDKSDTGDFGNVDLELWRLGCQNGQPKDRWALNIAQGVDHILSLYGPGKKPWGIVEKKDQDLCGTAEQRPNAAATVSTGGVTRAVVAEALWLGLSGGVPGRLALTSGSALFDNDRTTIGSVDVDNNGLWEFITPGLDSSVSDVPESCEEHNFIPGDTELPPALQAYFGSGSVSASDRSRILLQRCISHYNADNGGVFTAGIPGLTDVGACGVLKNQPCTDVVFGRDTDPTKEGWDIQLTPRYGYVPELDSSTPLGSNTVRFASFRPIYLQRLFGGDCTSTATGCSWTFEPDPITSPTPTYPAETKAAGLTVFVLPRTSLPGEIGSEDAPFDIGENLSVRLLR